MKRIWDWFKNLSVLGRIGLIIGLVVVGSLATYALSGGVKQKPKVAGTKTKKEAGSKKEADSFDGEKKPKATESEDKEDTPKLVSEERFKQYVVRIYDDPSLSPPDVGSFEIFKNGKRVYVKKGFKFALGEKESLPPMGKDITGDKTPDLVISEFTEVWTHCCTIYYIFSIGDKFKLIAKIDAEHGGIDFKNLDGDDNLELVTQDWTFAYWRTSFAESPAPEIILKYRDGAYHLASDLMKTPPPKPQEIRRKAQEVRNDRRWFERSAWGEGPAPWGYMLDLIYSGHKELARQFVDMAWPDNRGGKEEFLEDFESQLSKNLYWPEVIALSE